MPVNSVFNLRKYSEQVATDGDQVCVGNHDGAETKPAGPCPSDWPPTVLSSGLKPSSSVGIPNWLSLAS